MTSLRAIVALTIGALASTMLLIAPVTAAPGATSPAVYHQSASGKTVYVRVGKTLVVDLKTASGTPFEWVVVQGRDSKKIKIVSRRTFGTGSSAPGAPYRTVWTIKGTQRGTAVFKVVLRNVTDKTVARRFKITVRVTTPTPIACGDRSSAPSCVNPNS